MVKLCSLGILMSGEKIFLSKVETNVLIYAIFSSSKLNVFIEIWRHDSTEKFMDARKVSHFGYISFLQN